MTDVHHDPEAEGRATAARLFGPRSQQASRPRPTATQRQAGAIFAGLKRPAQGLFATPAAPIENDPTQEPPS